MKMSPFNRERADLLMQIMPPVRFDAICTEENVPDEINRGLLYADTMTLAYMAIERVIADGKPDPLVDREKCSEKLEMSMRKSLREANEMVRPLREAIEVAKAIKPGLDS